MRLALLSVAAAWLTLISAPALAQSAARLPTDANAPPYLLKYWRSHGAGSTLGIDSSETAPGAFQTAPAVFVHKIYGGPIPAAQADILKRRLEIAFKALMAQPSMADIHGTSLTAAINVTRAQTDDGPPVISASLSFNAKKIIKDDPRTVVKDGRYATPWLEGAVLEVVLNPYNYVARRNVQPGLQTGRTLSLNAGTTDALLVTDHPLTTWDKAAMKATLATDESWIGRPGIHPLLIRVAGVRHERLDIERERTPATAPLARLIAAAYMTDWESVHRQMAAVR